jgi:hypothetical protein
MSRRTKEISIDANNMSIQQQIEPGKVLIVVLDGYQGKVRMCEAPKYDR